LAEKDFSKKAEALAELKIDFIRQAARHRKERPIRLENAAIDIEKSRMSGWGLRIFWRCAVAAALLTVCFAPIRAFAQMNGLMGPQGFGPAQVAPGSPGSTTIFPTPLAPPPGTSAPPTTTPLVQSVPAAPAGNVALTVVARYGRDAPLISSGLIWRVYAANPDLNGTFRLVKEDRTASPTFMLPPGDYVVHASFGLASAAKAVQLRADVAREMFDIPAGGIRLQGRVNDVRIPTGQVTFTIYPGSQFNTKERRAIAQNVMTGDVVLLPEGTYYIVSTYGDVNSVVRSDVQVQSAKLTDVVVTHRAAVITLKLVNDTGEALASTQWTLSTPDGDIIKEPMGAFPRLVLADGDYHVMARNEGHVYQRDFKVINGVDGEVELLARGGDATPPPAGVEGRGAPLPASRR